MVLHSGGVVEGTASLRCLEPSENVSICRVNGHWCVVWDLMAHKGGRWIHADLDGRRAAGQGPRQDKIQQEGLKEGLNLLRAPFQLLPESGLCLCPPACSSRRVKPPHNRLQNGQSREHCGMAGKIPFPSR